MTTYLEVRDFIAQQPLPRMRYFAELLGWRGLQLETMNLPDEVAQKLNIKNGVIIYYCTTDHKFNLQINTFPRDQVRFHSATVVPDRYGISNYGFYSFELFEDDLQLRLEALRLAPILSRRLFRDRAWRRKLLRDHPEMFYRVRKRKRAGNKLRWKESNLHASA